MEVLKKSNLLKFDDLECFFYDFDLISGNKKLTIHYDNESNLHMNLESDDDTFYITKEDDAVFIAFDELYNNIIDGKPLGSYTPNNDYKSIAIQYGIIDRKKRIIWMSDDNSNNKMVINKINKNTYELKFDSEFNRESIDVVFSGYVSQKYPFNSPFILFYQQLQKINSLYHQINFDELPKKKELRHIS